jgi:hypothetical protein
MKRILAAAALAVAVLSTLQGCTTQLIEGQKQELATYEQKGLKVQEKSPGVAAGLGIFPTAGYFYTGHYVLAITTLPLYVFAGPLWMPFDTYNAAEARNYFATKSRVEREKAKAIRDNDHDMEDKKIDYEQHIRNQRVIEEKYSAY